ncbi:recombinase family protein [Brevundimonas sp. NPDC092305]|uniref:recombinase family protein n=1 Tax=Brevundimonas sp. NPDC092305 TaxID=3363957 RepID=UPI003817DB51
MKPKTVRCAVYTRKSSEEGLEQEYNSLHAQRDACEAYIRSQIGEGWSCLKTAYDDGGVSGGTMERPGLKQLLADIAARKIDVVVVYKVDRLTRSLWDFAKIVEVFDKHGVSFVSVTQSFNTTSSMGRLTLNMLLSFAQFEREVTSERIRDKIAASKKKGMWMGGGVPLGYEAEGRTLRIHEEEAQTVRHIFTRYLELKSVHALVAELKAQGVRSKLSMFSTGRQRGGVPIDRGAAYKLLANPAYLGKVRHKDEIYDGLHPPIIDQALFDQVQAQLKSNAVKRTTGSARRTSSPLMGKLFDENGRPMTPTFTGGRGGKTYRYYVSTGSVTGKPGKARRLPGPDLDRLVAETVSRLCPGSCAGIGKVVLREDGVDLLLASATTEAARLFRQISPNLANGEYASEAEGGVLVTLTGRLSFRGGRTILQGAAQASVIRPDRALVKALREGHRLVGPAIINQRQPIGPKSTYERRLAALAFLAPDIQASILKGTQPASLTLADLMTEIPLSWAGQRRLSGRQRDLLPRCER